MTRQPASSPAPRDTYHDDFDDDFDSLLASKLSNPEFAAAYEDAAQRARVVADLVSCRKAQDLKQRQVAEHMGVGQSQVSEFETAAADAHLSTIQRYARSVGARVVVKIEMPADQRWAAHARSYAARAPRSVEQHTTVVKEPDSRWLDEWVSQAKPASHENPAAGKVTA